MSFIILIGPDVEPKSFLSRPLFLLSYLVCFQGLDPKSFRFINYDALSDASVKHDACDATDATDDMCQSKA